jgi:transcription antitermination factor NusG
LAIEGEDGMTAECWVAVFSKQNAEARAYVGIEAAGFGAFYPVTRLRVHQRDGERYVITKSLFPNYLFAKVDPVRLHEVSEIDGVMAVLRGKNGKPSRIPSEVIEALRRAAELGLFDRAEPGRLKDGDMVKILQGPFAGLIGKIKNARRDHSRFQVVMEFVDNMTVPIDNLAKISA